MDIKKNYECLEQNGRVLNKNQDIDFDFQEALPAYLDDVYRVVSCRAESYITGTDISFNEIKVYGKVIITLTYYNENSGLCYADFEEEFSKSVTAEDISDKAFVCAAIIDKYTSFKVINQRRIDVHVSAVLHIDVYDKISCPCIKECSDSRLRLESINCADIIASDISKIEFDEEFSVPADSPSIKRIVAYTAFACINDIKVIKDKMLIKAAVNISVIYTSDNASEELLKAEYSFNASKIAEVSGIKDSDIVISDISVGNVFLKAKNNGSDRLDNINVYGEAVVNSTVIRKEKKELVTDAYVLNRNSECSYSDCTVISDGELLSDTRQVNLSYKLSSDISEIHSLEFNILSVNYKNSALAAQTAINGIATNASGELSSFSSEAEFTIDAGSFDGAIASICVNSYDFTINDSNVINLRASIRVSAFLFNEKGYKLISDIEAEDEIIDYPSVTVYFGSENESVWNIAKSFSSDTELIKKENALSSDILDSNKILIIPRV